MSDLIDPGALESAVRTFLSYARDLEAAGFDAANTKLRLVVNYSQQDLGARALAEQLLRRVASEEVLRRSTGDAFEPPAGAAARFAFAYGLLHQLRKGHKLELRQLLTRGVFQGSGLEGRWDDFKARVLGDLTAGLERVLAGLEALPRGEPVDADAIFARLLAPAGASPAAEPAAAAPTGPPAAAAPAGAGGAAAPSEAPAAASPPAVAAPASEALAALEARIRGAGLGADATHDLLGDARVLALELEKRRPDPERVADVLREYAQAAPTLVGAAVRVILEGGGEPALSPSS